LMHWFVLPYTTQIVFVLHFVHKFKEIAGLQVTTEIIIISY